VYSTVRQFSDQEFAVGRHLTFCWILLSGVPLDTGCEVLKPSNKVQRRCLVDARIEVPPPNTVRIEVHP